VPAFRLRKPAATGIALAVAPPAGAGLGPGSSSAESHPRALPARVFAPYCETWTTNRLIRVAGRSGARHFSLAFIQAPRRGSCLPAWNGDPAEPTSAGRYLLVERWARRHGRPLQISYTLPVEPAGLVANGLAVLRGARRTGTRVDLVNIMTFDYHDGVTTDMGGAAISAARGLHRQLGRPHPDRSARRLWAMEGVTILPGIDDYPRKTEVTGLADAARVRRFAERVGIGTLSMWAIQRDSGACPGRIHSNTCSGIVQRPWAFAHLLEPFTSGAS
jgi:hypothetical protein